MLLVTSDKNNNVTIVPSRDELSEEVGRIIQSAISKLGIKLETVLASDDFFLFRSENHIAFAQIREIVGRRLIIHGSFPVLDEIENNKCFLAILSVARRRECNLIQFILPIESRPNFAASGFYISNYLYTFDPRVAKAKSSELTELSDPNEFFKHVAPIQEYEVRWNMPGSTWPYGDSYVLVAADYHDLNAAGLIRNLSQAGRKDAYVLWLENQQTKRAIISMIHVESELRGKKLGSLLLQSASFEMAQRGIEEVRYVVSAHNVYAIRMLQSAGWSCAGSLVNRQV